MLFLGMFVGASPVSAGFGVSPSNIYHEYLKPGGHFEQKITLSRSDAEDDLDVLVEPALEEMKDWFSFDPGMKFVFPKGEKRISLTAKVDVPSDAPYKTYQGIIRVKAMTQSDVPGGVAIVKGARVDVELVTTKLNVTELSVTQMSMRDVVGGETLKLEVEVSNHGNTEVAPRATVKIMNLQMQLLEELQDDEIGMIKPNETKMMTAEFETKLGLGEYFGEASVLGEKDVVIRKERLVFRITDRSALEQKVIEREKKLGLINMVGNKEYWLKVGIELLVAALIVIVVKRGKQIWQKIKALPRKQIVLILKIGVGLMIMYGLWLGWQEWQGMKSKEAVKEEKVETSQPRGGIGGVEVRTGDGWVEGTATEGEFVSVSEGDKAYPVYSEPNSDSRLVYYAGEGDRFEVIDERADWYRISLPDTTTGWIAKASIKDKIVEEK